MLAPLLAVHHGVARQGAAVAVAAVIDKAAGRHGDDAIMPLGDAPGVFADAAEIFRRVDRQLRRVFRNDQRPAIPAAADPDDQRLIAASMARTCSPIVGLWDVPSSSSPASLMEILPQPPDSVSVFLYVPLLLLRSSSQKSS